MGGVPRRRLVLLRQITVIPEEPRVLQFAMPVPCRVLVPEVLPAVMPDVPAVPEFLPAPPPELVLPGRLPAGLPAEGRAALAAALAGEVPGGQQDRGELVRAAGQACWDEPDPRSHPVHAGRPHPGQSRHQPLSHSGEHAERNGTERSGTAAAPFRFPCRR